MTIDWSAFSPWTALAGGALIGIASAIFILVNGRIAGISGIVGGLLGKRAKGDTGWRLAFTAGMLAAPALWLIFYQLPAIEIEAGLPLLIVAGFLVGISTRYGGGCTSGHGVCGISRFSPRSMVATLSFMATGFATVYIVRHLIGV